MKHVSKTIESKQVVWFEEANQYLVTDPSFYDVLNQYLNGVEEHKLRSYCQSEFDISIEESNEIVNSCKHLQDKLMNHNKVVSAEEHIDCSENHEATSYHYQLNNKILNIQFCSAEIAELIHPKYSHLSTLRTNDICYDHVVVVKEIENQIALVVDNVLIGKWTLDELHFLQGKFAMMLINCSNNKTEADWLAVLHASAVSVNNESLVFLGESGSGKSTAITLLSLNGYNVLADDFVPVDAYTKEVVSYPAAISVKESMLSQLEHQFPQLKDSVLRVKDHVTNYKYLYLTNNVHTSKKCKALVFIKYKDGVENKLEEISKLEALEHLIPDSWISPKQVNAIAFLNWLELVPCYRLNYSDNDKMIALVDKLMKHEVQGSY